MITKTFYADVWLGSQNAKRFTESMEFENEESATNWLETVRDMFVKGITENLGTVLTVNDVQINVCRANAIKIGFTEFK